MSGPCWPRARDAEPLMNHVDPPDLALRPTLAPTLSALVGAAPPGRGSASPCALVVHRASITIPILIQQRGRQGDRRPGRRICCSRTSARSSCSRSLRFVVNFTRRFATARVGIAVEARLRGMLYHAYLTLSARVLRPARDGRGDLARDERHLPRPLLHRLGVVQGVQSAMMIIGAGDRAHDRERAARALRGAGDAADRRPHVVLRAQAVPDLAARPGEEGPPRRGDRRGGRRDRDGAGVRARGRRANALPRTAPRRCATRRCAQASVEAHFLPGLALPALRSGSPQCSSSAAAK